MSDIINQIPNENGESEAWITIKDASDLLGFSERHTWSKISAQGFQTKKLLNQHRKKLYVLRSDIEQFHKAEQERQRLDALKPSPLSEMSEMSEKKRELEMSERALSPLSEGGSFHTDSGKSLPALFQEREALQKGIVKWKVTAFWVSVLGLVIASGLTLSLYEMKRALSEREASLSESQKALSEMSERALSLSEREKEALKTVFERGEYIRELEDRLKKDQPDQQHKTEGGL